MCSIYCICIYGIQLIIEKQLKYQTYINILNHQPNQIDQIRKQMQNNLAQFERQLIFNDPLSTKISQNYYKDRYRSQDEHQHLQQILMLAFENQRLLAINLYNQKHIKAQEEKIELHQIEKMSILREKSFIQKNVESLTAQNNSYLLQFQTQTQELQNKYQDIQYIKQQNKKKDHDYLELEIQFKHKQKTLKEENLQIKQKLEAKNRQNQEYCQILERYKGEINKIQYQKQAISIESQKKIRENKQSFDNFVKQIEHKTYEIHELQQNQIKYEVKQRQHEDTCSQYKRQIQQTQIYQKQLKQRSIQLQQSNCDLSFQNKKLQSEVCSFKKELAFCKQKEQSLKLQIKQLQVQVQNSEEEVELMENLSKTKITKLQEERDDAIMQWQKIMLEIRNQKEIIEKYEKEVHDYRGILQNQRTQRLNAIVSSNSREKQMLSHHSHYHTNHDQSFHYQPKSIEKPLSPSNNNQKQLSDVKMHEPQHNKISRAYSDQKLPPYRNSNSNNHKNHNQNQNHNTNSYFLEQKSSHFQKYNQFNSKAYNQFNSKANNQFNSKANSCHNKSYSSRIKTEQPDTYYKQCQEQPLTKPPYENDLYSFQDTVQILTAENEKIKEKLNQIPSFSKYYPESQRNSHSVLEGQPQNLSNNAYQMNLLLQNHATSLSTLQSHQSLMRYNYLHGNRPLKSLMLSNNSKGANHKQKLDLQGLNKMQSNRILQNKRSEKENLNQMISKRCENILTIRR